MIQKFFIILKRISFLSRITSPLAQPAPWVRRNNFIFSCLVLDVKKNYALPMGIFNYMEEQIIQWNHLLAFLSLVMIPAIKIYHFNQKHITAGVTTGGLLKG